MDPDPDPALFFSGFQEPTKTILSLSFFAYYLITVGTFTSVFKDKLSRSHKTGKIKVSRNFWLVDERSCIRTNN